MAYTILTGEEFDEDFLPKIMDIDRKCYVDEYVGELSNMQQRFRKNRKTFVCVMDGDNVAGYINFFPTTPDLWEEIVESGMEIRDDDIRSDEIVEYSTTEENHLFIISVAIAPEYRGKECVNALTVGFVEYLNTLQKKGTPIHAIAGTAVSEDGQKFLRDRMFRLYREIHHQNKVYVCDGIYLQKFLKQDFYFKSYHDDVYLFLPYADNKKNTRINQLFDESAATVSAPNLVNKLFEELDGCLKYEYKSDIVKEMKRVYVGEFQFLHTLDTYEDEEDENARPYIVGEETAYISLFAHRVSHMYVIQIFIPDSKFSASQIQDQLSHGYIKIRRKGEIDQKGFYQYFNLDDYLKKEYGLISCGRGKSLLCMSNRPKCESEFLNILSSEVYNSVHQDFHIQYDELKKIAEDNRAIYDYYEVYLTQDVIAFILKDFHKDDLAGRIELAATYIFIAEIVLLQNTALNKMTIKVSNALAHEGDVSYQYVGQLYRDYAKTIKFWESNNYKYYGTQKEADQIKEAFGNDRLKSDYYEQQQFLEHIVDIKSAQDERKIGMVINIVAILLAVLQLQSYVVTLISDFYKKFGIPVESASDTFNVMIIGTCGLILLVWYILRKKNYHARKKKLSEITMGGS